MKPALSFSAFDPAQNIFDLFHDESEKIPFLPEASVPAVKPVQYVRKFPDWKRNFLIASDAEDLSKTETHQLSPSFAKLSKKEIDEAANGLFIIFSSATFAVLRTLVSNNVFFQTLAKTVAGADPNKIDKMSVWRKLTLNLPLKLASTGVGYATKTMAYDWTKKTDLSHGEAALAVTLACLATGAGFDAKSIMVKAGEVLGDPRKVTAKMVARAYFATLPLYLMRSGLNIAALTDKNATTEQKALAAAFFTFFTTPLINTAAVTNMNFFNSKTVLDAYIKSLNSFGLVEAAKKIAAEGFVEEARAPFRKIFAGGIPSSLIAVLNIYVLSPSVRANITEIMAARVAEIDEFISAHFKPKHKEEKTIDVEIYLKNITNVFQAVAAISARTLGSTKAAALATNNRELRIIDNLNIKMSGGIFSSTMALLAKDRLQATGKYSKDEINGAMAVVDQISKMLFDLVGQKKNLEKKAAVDPGIKIPGLAKLAEANMASSPFFTLRLFFLWRAANLEGKSPFQIFVTAAASNAAVHPGITLGMKVGYKYNQTANENIWMAYKQSLKEMGLDDAYNACKNQTFTGFIKDLSKAINKFWGGGLRSSIAAGIAAIFLSESAHKLASGILRGNVEDLVPVESKPRKDPTNDPNDPAYVPANSAESALRRMPTTAVTKPTATATENTQNTKERRG